MEQTIAGLASQIGLGRERLGQTQAGYGAQIGIGEEQLTQRQAEYDRQTATGQLGYTQATETGAYQTQQGITDLGQALATDVYGLEQDWERRERGTLNTILGMDIWGSDDPYRTRSLELAEDIGKEWEEGDESRFTTL